MNIVWSETAKKSYEKIIENLLENWDVSVAEYLEKEIIALEEKLKVNQDLCPESKTKN